MSAVAWLFESGRPVYHAADAAARYSHIYGPLAFMLPAWTMAALGPGLASSKALGAAAGLATAALVFLLIRRETGDRRALRFTAAFVALCLAFEHVSFWNRPDPLEALAAAVCVLAAVVPRGEIAAGLLLGAATGLLVDLKLTGAAYALPAFGVLLAERRHAAVAAAIAAAAVTAVLPFTLWPNVSFGNYLHWLQVSASNGLVPALFRQNVEWAVFLLLPLVANAFRGVPDARDRGLRAGLAAGMLLIAVAASKPGAGPYHLLPFVPALLFAASRASHRSSGVARRGGAAAVAYALTAVLIAGVQAVYFVDRTVHATRPGLAADVTGILDSHPRQRIEMATAALNEPATFVRPLLVFRQGDYLIDPPAVQEMQMSGVALPDATIRSLDSCVVDIWLVPRDGEPFSLRNRYPKTGYAPIFPDPFRRAFAARYERTASSTYFDLWTCKGR